MGWRVAAERGAYLSGHGEGSLPMGSLYVVGKYEIKFYHEENKIMSSQHVY